MAKRPAKCAWLSLSDALQRFVLAPDGTQGSGHIKPLHWYVACRLVVEGGFRPDEITPRPPFRIENVDGRLLLHHDPVIGGTGERTILGGLKTKDVDVVVVKDGLGPCLAVSLKGTLGAFRNLTNRMEEAAGDCTNLHISYPALVYGFWTVLRANKPGPVPPNAPFLRRTRGGIAMTDIDISDLAIESDGRATNSIIRYYQALEGLSGRDGVRDDVSRYEAVAFTLVDAEHGTIGQVVESFPHAESTLRLNAFFRRLYAEYDLRFLYQAPALSRVTRRLQWDPESPALSDTRLNEYMPRVGEPLLDLEDDADASDEEKE